MREVIATGKTVEQATENALLEIGLTRSEVSVEIIDMPTKKFLKTIPAKVKVTANNQENEPQQEKPVQQAQHKEEQKKKEQPKPRQEKKQSSLPQQEEIEIQIEENSPVEYAAEYLKSIFNAIGAKEIEIKAYSQGDATLLRFDSGDIQNLIETKGDVVQALSYLTDRAVNKGVDKRDENYLRVRLDIAGYRNRREAELIELAERVGNEVLKTKRSRTLSPMNPYERLIVHTAISKMEGLKSESRGEDNMRRVVVRSTAPDAKDGEDWRGERGGSNGRNGGRGNNNNRSRNSNGRQGYNRNSSHGAGHGKPAGESRSQTPVREFADRPRDNSAQPVVPERRQAIKDGEDIPLYGKIDI